MGRVALFIVAMALLMVATAACGSSGRTLARSYDDPALGFSIRYPSNWLVSRPYADAVAVGNKAGWVNVDVDGASRGSALEYVTKADFANLLNATERRA